MVLLERIDLNDKCWNRLIEWINVRFSSLPK